MEKISLHNISKTFNIGFKKKTSALESVRSFFFARESKKKLQALKSVSLSISSGEIVGIIGNNGSGKSTLLRIMAGIYKADSGEVRTSGKIISIINLGVGLMERLPMRDNILLVGSLFGMSNTDIKSRFKSIVAFSELEEFVDTKIYQFSAGMIQRLAFSIAIHANPDILLLDEVFEVGDENFRKKSSAEIKRLVSQGSCVVLVSHDMEMIEKNCSSVIEMSHGTIVRTFIPENTAPSILGA